MFSNTDRRGKMLVIWKLRDRPRRLISYGWQAGDRLALEQDLARS